MAGQWSEGVVCPSWYERHNWCTTEAYRLDMERKGNGMKHLGWQAEIPFWSSLNFAHLWIEKPSLKHNGNCQSLMVVSVKSLLNSPKSSFVREDRRILLLLEEFSREKSRKWGLKKFDTMISRKGRLIRSQGQWWLNSIHWIGGHLGQLGWIGSWGKDTLGKNKHWKWTAWKNRSVCLRREIRKRGMVKNGSRTPEWSVGWSAGVGDSGAD